MGNTQIKKDGIATLAVEPSKLKSNNYTTASDGLAADSHSVWLPKARIDGDDIDFEWINPPNNFSSITVDNSNASAPTSLTITPNNNSITFKCQ